MAHTYLGNGPHSKRSYISTAAFNSDIWAYQTQLNGVSNEGHLIAPVVPSTGAALTAALCPAGRILREAGRKLFPGVHPGLLATDKWNSTPVGTNTSYTGHMMVLVFDAVTGVKGYIDPNNKIFTVYNSDRANDFVDAAENVGGAPARLGQSIYTAGSVTGGPFVQNRIVTTLGTAAATLTGTQMVGTLLIQAAAGAQTLTLPATTAIISALGSIVGASADLVYQNTTANAVTVTVGDANTTLVGSATVTNTISRFLVVVLSSTTVAVLRSP